ncbi:helix-turn-helix transcriptional regulator [Rhizobium sp. SGZ-381]|uniref:helix-turn-helix transcriptional regulator n=1 Tax=Rhizobium sp. SGZ-381 TaxID=3342800 RepID=UPI003672D9F7
MARTDRLLDLLQILRRHRHPVSGEVLADELHVSIRTLYRDIATLRGQGADILGEPGMGYVLKPGFLLPPLMFSQDELEALVLGMRWVSKRTGGALGQAADSALARIAAVLPDELRNRLDDNHLLVGPAPDSGTDTVLLTPIRLAIRREHTLAMTYEDQSGALTQRIVWPIALGFFDHVRVMIAWCEKRQDFRHFRADRIVSLEETGQRYPRRKTVLLKEWRASQSIP